MKFSKRLNNFPEYPFSELQKKVLEVEKQSGRKVLNFGPGSPDFRPSGKYIQKYKEFIDSPNSHKYPGYGAIPELRDALVAWYKKRFNIGLKFEELYPLLGAKDGVSHLALALLDEDDEVLVPNPGYPAYSGSALTVNAQPISYNLQDNFKIDFDELEKKVSPKTKFMWVNFPSNPTGQVATIDELTKVVEFAKKHKIWIIYDNAYSEITFDGFVAPSILEVSGAKDVAIELGSFSKTFSFAGFRMGWMVGNSGLISALAKVKSQMDSGLSLPLQKLGAYALTNFDKEWYEQMLTSYRERRDTIAGYLENLDLKFDLPRGALYIWAKIPDKYADSYEFSMNLLERKQILFTPGTIFGDGGKRFVRISICINVDNIQSYF